MSNLNKLIEWMESSLSKSFLLRNPTAIIIEKALQLQKEEPKTYTQEEINIVTWENQVAIMKALRYLMPVQSDVNNKLKERIISTEEEIILHTPKTKQ